MAAPTPTQSSWSCFYPTLGIFGGAFLGWVIHFYLPTGATIDLAARTYNIIVSLIGWAIGVAFYGMQIHCGGSQRSNSDTRKRYARLSVFVLVPLILAPIFLIADQIILYFVDTIFLLAVICGEIKLGRPFWFLTGERIS